MKASTCLAQRHNFIRHWLGLGTTGMACLLLSSCSVLRPDLSPHPIFYSLDSAQSAALKAPPTVPATAPTLVVSTPLAAAGFDSPRIIYLRQPHQLEYFAHSEWIDTPARMLAPLVITALENSGAFRAVAHTPGPASGDLRLDTEVWQLQQEFGSGPSHVRFVLRAYLVEEPSRRVIATRQFEAVVSAPTEDTYGGVIAANEAVHTVLENLAAFCAEAVRK